MEKYAKMKGVTLMGTGDFTHPQWIEEIKQELNEDGSGFLKSKERFAFVLQTEISLIYTQEGKGRKVHVVVLAPSLSTADKITTELKKRGRVDYDGRPIFKIPCPEFVAMMRTIDTRIEIIPAHIWTPYFGVLGNDNQFKSIKECFLDQTQYIHALETGLSSDPPMNWRLPELDKFQLVSFSDLHSYWPWRIGREATVFEIEPTYEKLIAALRTGKGLAKTIEFWPHEGKYHYDGHRTCNVCLSPKESLAHNNHCPRCGNRLTIGVAHRVEELAERPEGYQKPNAKPFQNIIPLSECIAGYVGTSVSTKKVWEVYHKLITKFGNENNVLMHVPIDELRAVVDSALADILYKNRAEQIEVLPGYDGEYGVPIFTEKDKTKRDKETQEALPVSKKAKQKQKGLSEFF